MVEAQPDEVEEVVSKTNDLGDALIDEGLTEEEFQAAEHAYVLSSYAGLLSPQQSRVYSLRALHGFSREETADTLSLSKSRVDDALRVARNKIANAEKTIAAIEEVKSDDC